MDNQDPWALDCSSISQSLFDFGQIALFALIDLFI